MEASIHNKCAKYKKQRVAGLMHKVGAFITEVQGTKNQKECMSSKEDWREHWLCVVSMRSGHAVVFKLTLAITRACMQWVSVMYICSCTFAVLHRN